MANKDSNLTFVRCPSCNSLVPALSTRCRMCGADIEVRDESNKQAEVKESRIRQKTMTISESMKDAIMEDLGINAKKQADALDNNVNPLSNDDEIELQEDENAAVLDKNDPLSSFINDEDMDDIFDTFNNNESNTVEDSGINENTSAYDSMQEQQDSNVDINKEENIDDYEVSVSKSEEKENDLKELASDDFVDFQDNDVNEINMNEEDINHQKEDDINDLFSDLGDDILSEDLDFDDILKEADNESKESIHDDDLFPVENDNYNENTENYNGDLYKFDGENHVDTDLLDELEEDDSEVQYQIGDELDDDDFGDNIEENNVEENQDSNSLLDGLFTEDSVEDSVEAVDFKEQSNVALNKNENNKFDDDFLSLEDVLAETKPTKELKTDEASNKSKNNNTNETVNKREKIQRTTQEIEISPEVHESYEKQKALNLSNKKKNVKLNFGPKVTAKGSEKEVLVDDHKENLTKDFSEIAENNAEEEKKIEIKVEKVNKKETIDIPELTKPVSELIDVKKDMKGRLFGWLVSFKNSSGKAFELREGKFFITKSSLKENDLIINDDSISTPHALMTISKNNGLILQDLMSETGIYLKHQKEAEYEKQEMPFKVAHGDWVKFGNVEYLVSLIAYVGE